MEQLTLALTKDELLTFLAIIGVPTMNGLEDDPLEGLDERSIAERLNSGEHSLIQRGLLTLDEEANEATLDDRVVALVGGSVIPDATLLLSELKADGSNDPHYFNATPELFVEHFSPKAGIHHFEYLPDDDALANRLKVLLQPLSANGVAATNERRLLAGDILSQVIERVKDENAGGAVESLTAAGWPEPEAQQFVQDSSEHSMYVGVVGANLRSEEPEGGETVMIVGGDGYCWLVENESEEMVGIRRASGTDAAAAMLTLLEPLRRAKQSPNEGGDNA